MMRVIPFLCALLSGLFTFACVGAGQYRGDGLPQVCNPAKEIPEVRAWFGAVPLVMGVDSACSLPVVVFPEVALLCERLGPRRDGFDTAPVGVSFIPGMEPVVAYSHVVTTHGAPVQGLIGWPVTRRFVWHLQLDRGWHEFRKSVPQEVKTWRSLHIQDGAVARVQFPGGGTCLLDTGAPFGLYLSTAEWKRFLAAHPGAEVGLCYGESPAAGGSFCRPYTWAREVKLGPFVLRNIRVCESFSPLTGPRMLGRESLAQFDIWIDGPASRLYYRPR